MKVTYRRTAAWVVGLAALAAVAAACGGGSNASSTTATTSAPTTVAPTTSAPSPTETESPSPTESEGGTITVGSDTANNHGSKDVSGASSTEVELDDFYFQPTVITGKPGQKITFELKNEGSALHNFSLTAQSLDKDVQPGQTEDISITLPTSGFLEFFCKYHKALGMVGELKVP